MNVTFDMVGLPEMDARLDKIAWTVSNPLAKEALQAGGAVIQANAEREVHRLTGALAADIVVVTRVYEDAVSTARVTHPGAKYVLIGPGWDPDVYRRVAERRTAKGRTAAPDYTSNPGIYGYFLEVGHRAPGRGLNRLADFKAAQASAKKRGLRLNYKTGSLAFGNLTVPPYPWLEPAFETGKDAAFQVMCDTIGKGLESLGYDAGSGVGTVAA